MPFAVASARLIAFVRCGSLGGLRSGQYIVRRQRPPDPLQLELTDRLDLHGVLDLHQHSRTDEDLSGLRLIAQSRGNVRHGPDSGVVEPAFKADSAKCSANVASRLCDEAKPGQILISPRVLMKVENAVKVEPVGEFELKGIRRPLAAYNVVAAVP